MSTPNSIEELLGEFERFIEGKSPTELKQIAGDPDRFTQNIGGAIPEILSGFILALLEPSFFEDALEATPAELHPRLEEARKVIEEKFRHLRDDPEVTQVFKKAAAEAKREVEESEESDGSEGMLALQQNPGFGIATDASWKERNGKLWPLLRLAFVGAVDKKSVVAVLHPLDLLRYTEQLLDLTIEEFRRCVPYAEKDLLIFPLPAMTAKSLASIRTKVDLLRELAPRIGVKSQEAEPSAEGESDNDTERAPEDK